MEAIAPSQGASHREACSACGVFRPMCDATGAPSGAQARHRSVKHSQLLPMEVTGSPGLVWRWAAADSFRRCALLLGRPLKSAGQVVSVACCMASLPPPAAAAAAAWPSRLALWLPLYRALSACLAFGNLLHIQLCRVTNAHSITADRCGLAIAATLLATFLVFSIALREELPGAGCACTLEAAI